jgi:hypothetical protein
MAKREGKAELVEVKALLGSDPDYLQTMCNGWCRRRWKRK